MNDELDPIIRQRFEALDSVDVPETWGRAPADRRRRGGRQLAMAAAIALVIAGAVAVIATRSDGDEVRSNDPPSPPTTPVTTSTLPEVATTVYVIQPSDGQAVADPTTAAPGDTITITPGRTITRPCLDLFPVWDRAAGELAGHLYASGVWIPLPDRTTQPTWPPCLGETSPEPFDIVIPEMPPGEYAICITTEPEFQPDQCAFVEVLSGGVTATETPSTVPSQAIAVDAADPPPLVEPIPFVGIDRLPGSDVTVAIGETDVAVVQSTAKRVSLIDHTGSGEVREVELAEQMSSIVLGPGETLYGFGDPTFQDGSQMPEFRFVAAYLDGPDAGSVASEVLGISANTYTELPPGAFGHGPDGVIDRTRQVNTTITGYIGGGDNVAWDGPPLPLLTASFPDSRSGFTISQVGGPAWNLTIKRSPTHEGSFVGPSPPAPGRDGRVIWSDTIGDDLDPAQDFGPSAMPVVAILEPDGTGRWVRLPDDWSVAASDVWGTVLIRTTPTTIELAMLDDLL